MFSDFIDFLTKSLWNKNYPRTLIIFNINSVAQILSGILVLIFYFELPVETPTVWGLVSCIALMVIPILGMILAILNQEIYEWIVVITHVITGFLIVPLYFCTMGTFYGVALVMFVLTIIQSYVLINNFALKIATIAIQNTLYVFLMIAAAHYPQYFINYPGELQVQQPIFAIGIVAVNVYVCFLARVFVYVFKLDYERTVELTKNVETVNTMDDLTGAYNKETGLEILQTAMNNAWNSKDSLSIAVVDIKMSKKTNEENKYFADLIIVNAFDACRAVMASESTIIRLDDRRFLLILTECKTAYQVEPILKEINSHFALLMQAGNLQGGILSFGHANLLHGMSLKAFVAKAEKSLEEGGQVYEF